MARWVKLFASFVRVIMWENLANNYYLQRCFDFTGTVDMLVFTVSLLIVFFELKGEFRGRQAAANILRMIVHAACIYATWLVVGGAVFLAANGIDQIINFVPKLIVMALYVIFAAKGSAKSRIILAATLFVIDICIIEVGGCLTGVLNSRGAYSGEVYIRTALMVFTALVAVFLRLYSVKRFSEIPTGSVALACVAAAIGSVVAIARSLFTSYFGAFEGTDDYAYSLFANLFAMTSIIVIVALILVCYFSIYSILRSGERNAELQKDLVQLQSNEAMTKMSEENLRQMRAIRHDIKNRYSIMQSMIEEKRYDDLERYFEEVNSEAVLPLSQVNTGNPSMDAVLNLEISKAVAYGIKVETKLVIPPQLPFSDVDMDSLVTNVVDNAIEACRRLKEGREPGASGEEENANGSDAEEEGRISIEAQVVHEYFIFKVSNSMKRGDESEALSLETHKENKAMHGFGSKIIDRVVSKYDGQINRSARDGIFVVNIMLDLTAPDRQ